jgi:ParB family chromosome partitioning protein
MAGLDEIPAVIMTGDELKVAEIALIENVQRKDLNPIEEAMAYRALIEKFGLKQEEVAQQAGKSRSAVANMLRLLELPDEVLVMVQDEKLSMGHARAILGLEDEEKMLPLAEMASEKELSVREVEALVRRYNTVVEEVPVTEESKASMQRRIYMKELEDKARTRLGRKVKIHETNRKKTVELTYEDDEDLENLLKTLVGQEIFE